MGDEAAPALISGSARSCRACHVQRAPRLRQYAGMGMKRCRQFGGARRPSGAVACLVVVLMASACTSDSGSRSTPSASRATSVSPVEMSSAREVASARLDCNVIGHSNPSAKDVVVPGVVAITAVHDARLVVADQGAGEHWRYFAKTGLGIRGTALWKIVVPAASKQHLRVQWGSPGVATTTLLPATRCPRSSSASWSWYPGGFLTDRPGCYLLQVVVGDRRTELRVPVGKPCGSATTAP